MIPWAWPRGASSPSSRGDQRVSNGRTRRLYVTGHGFHPSLSPLIIRGCYYFAFNPVFGIMVRRRFLWWPLLGWHWKRLRITLTAYLIAACMSSIGFEFAAMLCCMNRIILLKSNIIINLTLFGFFLHIYSRVECFWHPSIIFQFSLFFYTTVDKDKCKKKNKCKKKIFNRGTICTKYNNMYKYESIYIFRANL